MFNYLRNGISIIALLFSVVSLAQEKGAGDLSFTVKPPVPALTTVACHTPIHAQYTVISRAPENLLILKEIEIDIEDEDTLPTNAVTIIPSATNSCIAGQHLKNGDECNITVNYQPCDVGTIDRKLEIEVNTSLGALTSEINTTVDFSLLVAVGQDLGTNRPLLTQSVDGGAHWGVVTVTGLSMSNSFFKASSCTGSGSTAWCVAAGQYNNGAPLLAQSVDGGAHWSVVTTGLPSSGSFSASSCTGSGSTAQCVAAGRDNSGSLLVQSVDGGANWNVVSVTGLSSGSFFNASSCTGSGSTALCVAAGRDGSTFGAPPLLVQSVDGGTHWNVVSATLPSSAVFFTSSCTGSGSTAQCVAGGLDIAGGPTFLAQSFDGGAHWSAVTTGLPSGGAFLGSSCTGSGSTAQCVAAGQDGSGAPVLVQSIDGGTHWSVVTVPSLTSSGLFQTSSCTGSGSTAQCVAAGGDTSGAPVLVQSIDGGTHWSVVTAGLPSSGNFLASSCTSSASTAKKCVAAGQDGSGAPLLVQSVNGGSSWSIPVISSLPSSGIFFGAGSASTKGEVNTGKKK